MNAHETTSRSLSAATNTGRGKWRSHASNVRPYPTMPSPRKNSNPSGSVSTLRIWTRSTSADSSNLTYAKAPSRASSRMGRSFRVQEPHVRVVAEEHVQLRARNSRLREEHGEPLVRRDLLLAVRPNGRNLRVLELLPADRDPIRRRGAERLVNDVQAVDRRRFHGAVVVLRDLLVDPRERAHALHVLLPPALERGPAGHDAVLGWHEHLLQRPPERVAVLHRPPEFSPNLVP